MKRTLTRSIFLLILAFLFFIGMGWFCYEYITNCSTWSDKPYNAHFSGLGLSRAGVIYDRYNNILAESIDGRRIYNSDVSIRKAMLHTVGDESVNISTAVQSVYRSKLTGYDLIFGYGMPEPLTMTNDIHLTLDSKSCAATYEAFNGRKGAAIVFNYETGEILTMVSLPSYDPENIPEIEDDDERYKGVYLNRVISSSYTPGSIFKLVTAVAAIENIDDWDTRQYYCSGEKEIGGNKVTCMGNHGYITMKEAMAVSCNIAFGDIAVEVGKEAMTKTARELGVMTSYKIDDNPTAKGNYDLTDFSTNNLAWSGIGQYTDKVSPIHMAILVGAIARGGSAIIPYSVSNSSIFDLNGIIGGSRPGGQVISRETAEIMDDMMKYTAGSYGSNFFPEFDVRAKTGTAEVGNGKQPNGWIVGYVTNEDCPLAFAVVVEEGGYGYSSAGPIAYTAVQTAAENLLSQQE